MKRERLTEGNATSLVAVVVLLLVVPLAGTCAFPESQQGQD